MREGTPKAIRLEDYRPPVYWVDRVALAFDLDADTTRVQARLEVRRNPASSDPNDLILNGEDLELQRIRLDGRPLEPARYRLEADRLILPGVPERFTLETEVLIHPAANARLEGLYLSEGMLCTQCEAEGFRRITYFPDRPDVMARYRVTLKADKTRYPVLLANGNLLDEGMLDDGRHFAVWEDPFPKPSYLFALVAGRLEKRTDTFTTMSGREVLLELYVESHDLDKCDHALDSLKRAMAWDERKYGREYDLDRYMIVAVSHFNMGAMENKGLNLFNSQCVLARPETATDDDFERVLAVVGHEYFHNWTGNRITLRDWFQLSLKEGLTVFREQQFCADEASKAVRRIEDVNLLRTRQFPEDEGPLAHPVRPDSYIEINNFYTMTVYEKGAEVVRMLCTLLGWERFRKGMDLYFERHDGQAVTCEDFLKAMEDANGVDLSQFLRWYTQAGTPRLEVACHYDAKARTFQLNINQWCPPTPGQPEKEPFLIPVTVVLLDPEGREIPLQLAGEAAPQGSERVLALSEAHHAFRFVNVERPPVLSILRDFSAPVKLMLDRPLDQWHFLWRHDTDPFNRWDAGQTLISQVLLAQIDRNAAVLDPHLVEGFAPLLQQPLADRAYTALLLQLPEEDYLAEQMDVIDVDGIHRVRETARRELAAALRDDWLSCYHAHHRPEEWADTSAAAIGRRRLKNTCLSYLASLDDPASHDLALQQYRTARCMSDQLAALRAIVCDAHPAKTETLADFYDRWRHEPLVIDKWFALQAADPSSGALERVRKLLAHPDFDLKNPNRVRAVLGVFARQNPVHFHARDGSGYQLLADWLLNLDRINPQVAARLAQPLTAWRRYDPQRARRMHQALERLRQADISKDLFEIVTKALEG
ncbi:aminopeptidase N [Methylomarinovum caldicuralii]|uniref:Aminopeptidase N n=1 Tax=Methylomarinovum caldicuralii TaxID=438856 RepID=A0AAU9BWC3_9GAMM|nr:aminopeptidase N [Methylomarinovum caldicuralii]BCX80455.1 aminopeptidase N [Methylomarinovum caldicuralii]